MQLDTIKNKLTFSFSQIILTIVSFFFTTMIVLNHIYPKVSYYNNLKISYIVLAVIATIVSGLIFWNLAIEEGQKDFAVHYNKYREIYEATLLGVIVSVYVNILISMATGMWFVLGASLLLATPYTMFIILGHYAMAASLATCGESG